MCGVGVCVDARRRHFCHSSAISCLSIHLLVLRKVSLIITSRRAKSARKESKKARKQESKEKKKRQKTFHDFGSIALAAQGRVQKTDSQSMKQIEIRYVKFWPYAVKNPSKRDRYE